MELELELEIDVELHCTGSFGVGVRCRVTGNVRVGVRCRGPDSVRVGVDVEVRVVLEYPRLCLKSPTGRVTNNNNTNTQHLHPCLSLLVLVKRRT